MLAQSKRVNELTALADSLDATEGALEGDGGRVVHQYEGGGRFGELALLYDRPRAASVVAVSSCDLWRLERWAFDEITKKSSEVQARMLL